MIIGLRRSDTAFPLSVEDVKTWLSGIKVRVVLELCVRAWKYVTRVLHNVITTLLLPCHPSHYHTHPAIARTALGARAIVSRVRAIRPVPAFTESESV